MIETFLKSVTAEAIADCPTLIDLQRYTKTHLAFWNFQKPPKKHYTEHTPVIIVLMWITKL